MHWAHRSLAIIRATLGVSEIGCAEEHNFYIRVKFCKLITISLSQYFIFVIDINRFKCARSTQVCTTTLYKKRNAIFTIMT